MQLAECKTQDDLLGAANEFEEMRATNELWNAEIANPTLFAASKVQWEKEIATDYSLDSILLERPNL